MDQVLPVAVERGQNFLQRTQAAAGLGGELIDVAETLVEALAVGIGFDLGKGGRKILLTFFEFGEVAADGVENGKGAFEARDPKFGILLAAVESGDASGQRFALARGLKRLDRLDQMIARNLNFAEQSLDAVGGRLQHHEVALRFRNRLFKAPQ